MPRGGWRPGAGRKPVPKSKAEAKFSPETLTLPIAYLKKHNKFL